jgi:threonine/homoserine/homoserine lactone efflux protein
MSPLLFWRAFLIMELQNLIAFFAAAVGLTFMPGPDNLYVISESLSSGSKRGVHLSFGLASGVLVHTMIAGSGLALLLKTAAWLYSTICFGGACYLGYLAYQTKNEQQSLKLSSLTKSNEQSISFSKSWRKGFIMNLLNPKVSLFFLALLPQFLSTDGWPALYQFMAMGALFMIQAFLIFSALAMGAGMIKKLFISDTFSHYTKIAKMLLLSALALGLVLEGLKTLFS